MCRGQRTTLGSWLSFSTTGVGSGDQTEVKLSGLVQAFFNSLYLNVMYVTFPKDTVNPCIL